LEGLGKPRKTFHINGKVFKGMISTGADVSCLRKEEVPQDWPLIEGPPVLGVASCTPSSQVRHSVTWEDCDGEKGCFCPLVLQGLPNNLFGWDDLGSVRAVITTEDKAFYEDMIEDQNVLGSTHREFEEGWPHPKF
jgi:hypothetical protein